MIALPFAAAAAAAAAALLPAEASQVLQYRYLALSPDGEKVAAVERAVLVDAPATAHAVMVAAESNLHAAQAARAAAFQAHDVDALAALVEPDFNFSSHKFHLQGREAFAKGWRGLLSRRPDLEFVHTAQSLRLSDDGQDAVEQGLWRERWREPDGPVILTGEYLTVWVSDADCKWRVASEVIAPLACEGGAYCRD
jgi:ketosteroid isomerase-like protein